MLRLCDRQGRGAVQTSSRGRKVQRWLILNQGFVSDEEVASREMSWVTTAHSPAREVAAAAISCEPEGVPKRCEELC